MATGAGLDADPARRQLREEGQQLSAPRALANHRLAPEIDQWIRRRLRMCYWKPWRWARTKVRHLLALGVGKRQAILTGISSKSYWHLSKTKVTQMAMSNDWLKGQGLISVRDPWLKAQGYA